MSNSGQQNEKDLSDIENEFDMPADETTSPYDVPLDELLSGDDTALTKEDIKKLKQIGLGIVGVIAVITLLSIYGCQPKKASMAYGLCSTFLELNTPYPQSLKYTGLEGSRTAVRIYYTSTDPFGQYKQEMIECKFGPDEKMGMKITEVLRNRRPMDAEAIKKFNLTLPIIMASDPYLVAPGPDWENQLLPR